MVYTNLGQPYHEGVVTDGIVVDHRYLILGSFYSCTSNHDWNYVGVLTVLSLKVRCTDEAQKAETVVPYACLCIGYTVCVCVCACVCVHVCVCVSATPITCVPRVALGLAWWVRVRVSCLDVVPQVMLRV